MIELNENLDTEIYITPEEYDCDWSGEIKVDVNDYLSIPKYSIDTDNLHDEWKLELFVEHANNMTLQELQKLFAKNK